MWSDGHEEPKSEVSWFLVQPQGREMLLCLVKHGGVPRALGTPTPAPRLSRISRIRLSPPVFPQLEFYGTVFLNV